MDGGMKSDRVSYRWNRARQIANEGAMEDGWLQRRRR